MIRAHLRRRFRKLGHSGAAIIEFALAAPLLVSLLFGVADLAPTLMVKFKVGTATQAVADLAAQSATVQTSDAANFFSIGSDVMAPFSGTPLVLRISNIASNGNNKAFVYWSCGQGILPALKALDPVSNPPTGLISLAANGTDTSYVIVESQYSYTPPAAFVLQTAQIMAVVAYTLPRVSTYIGPTTGAAGYVPTKPTSSKYTLTTNIGSVTCNSAY